MNVYIQTTCNCVCVRVVFGVWCVCVVCACGVWCVVCVWCVRVVCVCVHADKVVSGSSVFTAVLYL